MAEKNYQVLARKYRPTQLSELKGQDALVRTISNAIDSDRIPHAFILTGIRGVGKTSTARIIARSLLCTGKDGNIDKPTKEPCGVCEQCKAIAEDRHVDVLEMDAASRTGVGDIREIIENVHYLPVLGRYKIYIIDEVHMLSKSAFNALLKTLEEPPSHTKFVFATTEIRKIPITILSRCMRFDLPRVDVEDLSAHLQNVASQEEAKIDEEAVRLIAYASEGSVRDALSLLDRVIAFHDTESNITSEEVRKLLGYADKDNLFNMIEAIIEGKTADALEILNSLYGHGADPVMVLQDLLEVNHALAKLKVANAKGAAFVQHAARLKEIADKVGVAFLSRSWQMLVKGIAECQQSPNTLAAAEMVLIRLSYASNLPTPGDLVKKLKDGKSSSESTVSTPAPAASEPAPVAEAAPEPVKAINDTPQEEVSINSFVELVELFSQKGEGFTHQWLKDVSLVKFDAAKRSVEFKPVETTPNDLANRVSEHLAEWTGERWFVMVSSSEGEASISDQQAKAWNEQQEVAKQDPLVVKVLDTFEGAEITEMRLINPEGGESENMKQAIKENRS